MFLYNYVFNSFSGLSLEQIIYGIKTATGTSEGVIIDGAIYIGIRLVIFYILFFIIKYLFKKFVKTKSNLTLKIKSKTFSFKLYPLSKATQLVLVIIFSGLYLFYIYYEPFINDYISTREKSGFFDKYYISPNDVEISAPKDKRNLIYIYVESLESSMVTQENGGAFTKKVTPNLEKLALDNISFSNNNKIGGAHVPYGAGWTIAALVSTSSGTPLKIPISGNEYWNSYGKFLPGVVSVGDILKENGYKNYFLLGSDANFGGRNNYFSTHGDYEIYDYYYAIEQKWIDEDYNVWWGYEDKKLFEYAKETLNEIAEKEEPFNFTMLTADTHFTDGYYESECENPFEQKYLNSYHCSDNMIGEFINWIKKQDFYENTTIIICGDHLTMQANITDLFDIEEKHNYDRRVYNVFINSKEDSNNTKNREFNTFDLFPTTLASLGFEIKGERLGLGTNLFSKKESLTEALGHDNINRELKMISDYYNNNLLGSESYDRMMRNDKK